MIKNIGFFQFCNFVLCVLVQVCLCVSVWLFVCTCTQLFTCMWKLYKTIRYCPSVSSIFYLFIHMFWEKASYWSKTLQVDEAPTQWYPESCSSFPLYIWDCMWAIVLGLLKLSSRDQTQALTFLKLPLYWLGHFTHWTISPGSQ